MPHYRSLLNALQESDVFKGLNEQQYGDAIRCGHRKMVAPQGNLFLQGDPALHCYLVNHGRLKLTKLNEQGKEVIIRYIGAGQLTAAAALIKDGLYPVTAASVQETEVTAWDKPTMMGLMRRYPDIAINLQGIWLRQAHISGRPPKGHRVGGRASPERQRLQSVNNERKAP